MSERETARDFEERASTASPKSVETFDVLAELKTARKDCAESKPAQWELDKTADTTKTSLDQITYRATVTVPFADLKQHNRELPALGELKPGGNYKVKHATTGEVDDNWRIRAIDTKKESVDLERKYSLRVQHKDDHSGLVETTNGVPDTIAQSLQKKLDQLPANVIANLKGAGYKILAAPTIIDALPGLKGLTPRGWPTDTTFDHSDGTHDNVAKLIIAPMRFKRPGGDFEPVLREEVVVHQIGHALDFANNMLSAEPQFKAAYAKDMLLANPRNPIIAYLSQQDGVGRQETFATLFGLVLTGPENEADRAFLETTFPNTISVVKDQIKALK